MQVKIYDVDRQGNETFRTECDLLDCLFDDEEYQAAVAELRTSGRYWTGGGAAPLTLLMGVER